MHLFVSQQMLPLFNKQVNIFMYSLSVTSEQIQGDTITHVYVWNLYWKIFILIWSHCDNYCTLQQQFWAYPDYIIYLLYNCNYCTDTLWKYVCSENVSSIPASMQTS